MGTSECHRLSASGATARPRATPSLRRRGASPGEAQPRGGSAVGTVVLSSFPSWVPAARTAAAGTALPAGWVSGCGDSRWMQGQRPHCAAGSPGRAGAPAALRPAGGASGRPQAPGSPRAPGGISTREGAKVPSGPRRTCYAPGMRPAPHPSAGGTGGGVPSPTLVQGEPRGAGAVLGLSPPLPPSLRALGVCPEP